MADYSRNDDSKSLFFINLKYYFDSSSIALVSVCIISLS
jgi:hypothetical protein